MGPKLNLFIDFIPEHYFLIVHLELSHFVVALCRPNEIVDILFTPFDPRLLYSILRYGGIAIDEGE